MNRCRTALVVDDDDSVRRFMALPLSRNNFRVLEASNGLEALDRAGEFAGQIDLLVTDIEMPQMGGRELAVAFRDKYPGASILFVSGFSPRQIAHFANSDFLPKPFAAAQLMERVNRLLAPAQSRPGHAALTA